MTSNVHQLRDYQTDRCGLRLDTVDSLKYKVRCESGTVSALKIRTLQSRRHGTFLHLPTVCPHPLLSTRRINQISLRIVKTKPGKPTICWDRRYLPTISFLSPLRESYFLWWRPPTLPLTMTMWCFLEVDSLDWNDYFFCYQQIHRYHRSTIIFWPQNFPYNLKKLLAILFCLGLFRIDF